MNQDQVADTWSSLLEKNESALEAVIGQDPFTNWDRNRMPESLAERRLTTGLAILYGRPNHPLAEPYLQQAVQVADRAIAEDSWNEEPRAAAFPQNRGRARRARAYAAVMLGEVLRRSDLVEAGEDYYQWCKSYKGRQWNDQAEAYYLAGVGVCILGGDLRKAASHLETREFRYHAVEARALRAYLQSDLDLNNLSDLLNELRSPSFKPPMFMEWEILRLELAMMYCARNPAELGSRVARGSILAAIVREA